MEIQKFLQEQKINYTDLEYLITKCNDIKCVQQAFPTVPKSVVKDIYNYYWNQYSDS